MVRERAGGEALYFFSIMGPFVWYGGRLIKFLHHDGLVPVSLDGTLGIDSHFTFCVIKLRDTFSIRMEQQQDE